MMQIFATFEHSIFLEIAISELSKKGIEEIFAVPLNKRPEQPRLLDSLHKADGVSLLDLGLVLATMFSTIGASKGFVWAWGPIYCGILGGVSGLVLGVLIKYIAVIFMNRKTKKLSETGTKSEVILIITCDESQSKEVEHLLWDHYALGLSKIK